VEGRAGVAGGFRPGFAPSGPPVQNLSEIQKGRTQRVESGGKVTVIQENDNRVIVKQNNITIIRQDDTPRFARYASDVRSERRPDGTTQTVIVRPGGVQVYSVFDNSGRVLHRYRRDESGREISIIDNRRFYRNVGIGVGVGLAVGAVALALRPPDVRIERAKYIVDYERASDDDIYEALSSAPIERLERRYSLDEIRFSRELRDRMRRVDLDTITFEFGSWDVGQEQFPKLERIAKVIGRITSERPNEVFLIEGHTDAVGSDVDNLTLSDRRAQAVAEILSSAFNVPPENLVTQGYGEQHLKIPTQEAERQNRRVAVRRITPLMSEGSQ
jgi:outer membrane protein OmpA-like peptidoglycan-associated protein